MNKLRPFIQGLKSDDVPDCYNRVRYIRDACKVLSDVYKTDKDFLNKSLDGEVSKMFKEFRVSEVARNYRSPYGPNGASSILNRTIDDLVQIHDHIDTKRKESLEQIKKLIDQAKDKQLNIRQSMTELKENYEKAQRKLETADANLKKFQTRSDRHTFPNYDERSYELEEIRSECEQSRTLARDTYATETYKVASEEHLITRHIFCQYLFEQNQFYHEVYQYLSLRIPSVEQNLEDDLFRPSFHLDLTKHCSKRYDTTLAYPIEICIKLLENHLSEEGLFRIAPSHGKQKKFVAELDLQLIDRTRTLNELGYDPHVPANTLKQYLRQLPECLLTNALFTQWNEIPLLSNDQLRLQRIGQLINQLPKINYDNLCYLVRFLSRVAEYSLENKMTVANLSICIGCNILYPKDQTSNSYTSGSIILELMILHHKQLFSSHSSPIDLSTKLSLKSQPDLIPTEFHSKSRSNSNENLLESQYSSTCVQPSPGTRRKNKAPPPPPPPPPPPSSSVVSQSNTFEENSPESNSTQYLTDSSPSTKPMKNIYRRFTRAASSSSFSTIDQVHRRTPSDGIQLDRPGAPPPLPPPVVVVVSSPIVRPRERLSIPLINSSHTSEKTSLMPSTNVKLVESNETSTTTADGSIVTSERSDGVKVGRLISELNNRMAAAKMNPSETNNIRASSIRHSTLNSPAENTDF